MKLIERNIYLDRIKSKKGSPDIKIITGIRRAGKSKLLLSYMDYLRKIDDKANIIFIDFRLLNTEPLKEYHALNNYIEAQYICGRNNYICIDEIQMCEHFELAINSLHATEKYDIYLTGSNAFMLSSDLATLFTGRYIEIQVFPFSFNEYRKYFGEDDNIQRQFDNYVIEGGLAGSYLYEKAEDKTTYIRDVYNTILQRDLVEKYNLPDNRVLTRLVEYMMDNVSNISSPNSISENLTKNGISTNHVTISAYLEYLAKSFVLYKIDRYDIRGKKYLQSLNKFYLADTGIRFAVLGHRNMDWGRMYENIVCLELLRRGYEIYVGKLYQKEIDFVAIKGSEKLYVQVSDDISNEGTFAREYTPLLQIRDAYPKMIIARTRNPRFDYQGIEIVDLAEWLVDI
ncbi:MAG: ATP-binding protein [Bacteroidia bacterium]|nr:ATP-binding protein [Bacteroidia bacterium]